jgi:Bacterial Ig-like domain (group 3)
MRSAYLRYLIPGLCLSWAVFLVNPIFGQASPTITNITNAANPASSFPALTPGDVAVITGANLADSTASAAPPQTLLGGVEVHFVSSNSDFLVGLVYVSPTGISFVVPYIPNTEVRNTRIVIVKGGRRFDDLTSPGSVIVGAVAFESSPNPALYDQPITLTAHLTVLQGYPGSLANTIGAVTFMDGENPIGTVTLSNVMTFVNTPPSRLYDVSLTTSKLAAGDHSIWVSYTGDNNNKAGTSGVIPQSVQKPEITIWSSPNPSLQGHSVGLVATFSPSTCTGSVTFFDEKDELGTATLDRGRALLLTSDLPVGNHPITVTYGGDGTCPALVYGPANNYAYRTTSQTVN